MTKLASEKAVVDASYILSLLLPDEDSAHDHVPASMLAPYLLPFEVVNGLSSAVIQGRITQKLSQLLFQEFSHFPITYKEVDFQATLKLAILHKLSAYDASYLWLASSQSHPLKPLDQKLSHLSHSDY